MKRAVPVEPTSPLSPFIDPGHLSIPRTTCFVVTGAIILWSSGAAPVQAHPTGVPLVGPTGLGTIPTTETVPGGQVEAGLSYENVKTTFGRVRYVPVATATYGFGRGEVGVAYMRERLSAPGFSLRTNFHTLHGKYRVYDNERGSAVAVGAHYLDFGSGNGALTSLYATGSHDFLRRADGAARARGHLGLIYQRTTGAAVNTSEVRPMVGAEYFATPALTLAADYVPRKELVARTMSLALRYQGPSNLGAQIGVGKLQNDTKYFVGVTYRFGKSRGSGAGDANTTAPNTEVQR